MFTRRLRIHMANISQLCTDSVINTKECLCTAMAGWMLNITLKPVPMGAAPVRHKGRRWQPNCNMQSSATSSRRSSEPSGEINLTAKLLHHKLPRDASFETQLMHLSGPIEGLLVFSSELRKSDPTHKKKLRREQERTKHLLCFCETFHELHKAKLKLFELFWDLSPFSEKKWCRRAKCCGWGQATFRPSQNEPQLKPLKLGHVIIVASPAVAKSRSEENWRPAKNENTISNKCFLHNRIKCVRSKLYQ